MRQKGLNFLPKCMSYDNLDPKVSEAVASEETDPTEEYQAEMTLLQMIFELDNDKQRLVLLFNVLRGLGYNLDHDSIAEAMGINRRWYLRLKNQITDRLDRFNTL